MKEKVIELIIFWVTGAYKEDKHTKDTCIEVIDLLLLMMVNKENGAEDLINIFPQNNPVNLIYQELKENTKEQIIDAMKKAKKCIEKYNFDENAFENIEIEEDVEELSKKISEV